MSLGGHGPKSGSGNRCLIIALTGQQCPVLFKSVHDAARPPEGDLDEAGSFAASSLPLSIDSPAWMLDSPLKSFCTKQWPIFVSASHQAGLDTRSMTRRSIIVGI